MTTIIRNRVKKKRDLIITLQNPDLNYKNFNLFKDGFWEGIDKKDIPSSFIVGSIIISCTNTNFFWMGQKIELGDKIYDLSHYISQDNNMQSIIYNFDKGWLAPLNVPMSTSKDIIFQVPASTSVKVSISVV